ncbi:MAG: S8 family serine peptidase [bacterium]|nr:S8 family serine peptidase [bacterium]
MRIFSKKIFFSLVAGLVLFLSASSPSYAVYNPTTPIGSQQVANEIIVKFKPSQTPDEIRQKAEDLQNQKGVGVIGAFQYYFYTFSKKAKNEATPQETLSALDQIEKIYGVTRYEQFYKPSASPPSSTTLGAEDTRDESNIKIVKTDGNKPLEEVVNSYKSLPEVEFAMTNSIFTIQDVPDDPSYADMWALKKMQMEKAWTLNKGSNDVTVAIIDTGADYNHPDLKNRLLPGYDASIGVNEGQDLNGHGTHTAGTIGAITNNKVGISGITWNTKILPIRALDSVGAGSLDTIANGISYATSKADELHIKVISMSLGGCRYGEVVDGQGSFVRCHNPTEGEDTCEKILNVKIQAAIAKKITIVVAAGNASRDANLDAPASCPGVVTVGATDQNDNQASFSNFGSPVTLAAPGVGILSTMWSQSSQLNHLPSQCFGQSYCPMNGTSMATPHVAGVVALMYAVNPNLTPDRVKQIFSLPTTSAESGRDPGPTALGGGRLNAEKALKAAAMGTETPTATLTPTPSTTLSASPSTPPNTSPTSTPSPTPTPVPLYSCTPRTLPLQTVPADCACAQGSCNSQCTFYEEKSAAEQVTSEIVLGVSTRYLSQISLCPIGSTCLQGSVCQPFTRMIPNKSCGLGLVCCSDVEPTATPIFQGIPTATPTIPKISPLPTGTISPSPTVPAAKTIACKDAQGADQNSYCRRPLRTAGDVNGDGKVDMLDYFYFRRVELAAAVKSDINADINGDGKVDSTDKQILIGTLNKACY